MNIWSCLLGFHRPAVFQSFINDVFRDMLNRQVVVYIDDILIYSDTLEDHVQHVRAVLQRLIQYQLFAKIEKCDFHQTSISFLGYIISPGGVAMDEGQGKGSGGMAQTYYAEGAAALPWVRKLLPPLHQRIQYGGRTPHGSGSQRHVVSSLE